MQLADYGGLVRSGDFDRAAVEDLESLRAAVLEANRFGTPIRIRGNGHSMNGSSVPRDGELLVSTEAFRHFRFEDPGTVTVGAGVAVWDADRFLRERGYRLLVVNDGGKPASTVGGYLSAGGFGAASSAEGGFWETVTKVKMVTGDGRIVTSRAGEPLFPWLFGSMGQLALFYEVTLRIAAVDDATPRYPLGESGQIEATRAEWEKIAWFTLFAPARLRERALELLSDLDQRHAHVWNRRPIYLYDIAFKTFHPPLIHPSSEPLIAAGIWGTPNGDDGFDPQAMAALEADFMVLLRQHPDFRRYLQAEMTFHPEALRLNLGAAVYDRFQDWKRRLDPNHVLTRGILAATEGDRTMTVQPFHIFSSGGQTYVHDIEGRRCSRITEGEAETLRGLSAGEEPSPREAALLEAYGLLEGGPAVTPGKTDVAVHSVTLLTTHACNFSCTYCYEYSNNFTQPHSKPGRMNAETARRTIDWLIATSGDETELALGFFGGEPLLNFPLIEEAVAYANEQGAAHGKRFRFSMTTNGSLLTDEIIAFLKRHEFKTTISMDGGKEVQNAQRPMLNGGDSYETVRPRAAKLLAEMPQTSVQATLCGDTDPRQVKRDLAALGFRNIGLTNVSPSSPEEGQAAGNGLWSAQAMTRLLDDEAAALRKAVQDRDAEAIRTPHNYLCSRVGTFLTGEVKEHHCGAGKASVAVANSGDIYLCHRFADLKDYRLGHIDDATLDRAAYQVKPVGSVDACSSCFSRYHCPGGCYHDNLNNTGSAFTPNETLCNVSRHMTELAAAISADLSEEDVAFLVAERLVPADARRRGRSRPRFAPESPVAEVGLAGLASVIPAPWGVD